MGSLLHKTKKSDILVLTLLTVLHLSPSFAEGSRLPAGEHPVLQSASELDYPPFAIVRDNGTADGFSIDLLQSVVSAMGRQIHFTVGPWHGIKQQLITGELDVLPLVSYSEERDRHLDFSAPYMRLHGTAFVRKDDPSIKGFRDLKGKEVLVMKGDNAHEYALENRLTDKLILTDNYEQALHLLSSGRHDAVLMLQLVGLQLLNKLSITNVVSIRSDPETDIRPGTRPLSGYEEKFCFAVPEGEKDLLALLNEGLAIVIANGIYNELYDAWFGPILPQPRVGWGRLLAYLFSILVPVLLLAAILGLWYLRREVAGKTRHLKAEIREREKAQKILQESENRFRKLFEVVAIPLCYVNDQGMILDFNPRFTQVFGYTRSDIPTLEKWWERAYPDPEYRKWVKTTWQAAVEKSQTGHGDIQSLEYRVTCKNGDQKNVVISGSTFQEYFLATFIDLTEIKQAETILEKTLSDLKKSNAELEQFAYVASHDLQEPLRAAVGFLQLLQSKYNAQLDEKANHYIERAVKAGHRMQSLISDLLKVSRVSTADTAFEPADLSALLEETLGHLESTITKKNAKVTCSRLPSLMVDRHQILSLFQNLIVNALKYNDDPQPAIEIEGEDQGHEWRFFVRDNGIGIGPQFHEKIFMIFQRLHSRKEYSGSGIGLALCKKIVERHGGTIWVESEPGKGATFYFTLASKGRE